MKFSIRDLFWLTVVVALAVGWWLDHRQLGKVNEYLQFYERHLLDTHTNGFPVPSGRVIPGSVMIKENGMEK